MKKDAIESLTKIRELCNDVLTNKDSVYLSKEILLLGRIEWICRHALEDYEVPNEPMD